MHNLTNLQTAHLFKLDSWRIIMLLNAKQACGYLNIGRYLFNSAVNKGLIRTPRFHQADRGAYSVSAKQKTHTLPPAQQQNPFLKEKPIPDEHA